jgi:hypothetical protein
MSVNHPLESIARGDAVHAHREWASWRILPTSSSSLVQEMHKLEQKE